MKLFYTIVLTMACLFSQAQVLEENRIDEYTGASIKKTSWEYLIHSWDLITFARVSNTNGYIWLDLKIMQEGHVFSIGEGDLLLLKLENGKVISLKNNKFTVTCTGCGAIGLMAANAQGVQVSYLLSYEQAKQLKENTINGARIYTTDGYFEKDIKTKRAKRLSKALELIE